MKRVVVAILVIALAGVAFSVAMRPATAEPLVERLDDAPPPPSFTEIDRWERDEATLFKPRPAEATRIYSGPDEVGPTCLALEVHHAGQGWETTEHAAPPQECRLSLRRAGDDITVFVIPLPDYRPGGGDGGVEVTYMTN